MRHVVQHRKPINPQKSTTYVSLNCGCLKDKAVNLEHKLETYRFEMNTNIQYLSYTVSLKDIVTYCWVHKQLYHLIDIFDKTNKLD